jgi:pimeloyl-ACP methyl ester carboxylesterase
VFLHGFASSARSTKGTYLADRLSRYGIDLLRPDLNHPDFRTMTMTGMLDLVSTEIDRLGRGVTLIGSSLGGTLAVLAAERLGLRVERLVLMAPAVMFGREGHHLLPADKIDAWRRTGATSFFHHGLGAERVLDYAFYDDSLRYDPFGAAFTQPTIAFQGVRDTAVEPAAVEAFAASRPNVTLTMLDDDHQLTASLPRMWSDIEAFLGLGPKP